MSQFRSKAAGVPDLLNWAFSIASGVVLLKSGGLLAGYYYRGSDAASATPSERNLVTERINEALKKFGGGWSSWTDCVRIPSPGYSPHEASHFPDPISKLIDAERREYFETHGAHYESQYLFLVQYTPPADRKADLQDWFYDDDPDQTQKVSPVDRALENLEQTLRHMEDTLGDALLIRRMGAYTTDTAMGETLHHDELVDYLDYCLTGDVTHLVLPEGTPVHLDTVLGGVELHPGDTPLVGNRYIRCVHISGYPKQHYPGILDALDQLPVPFRWSTRMIYLDPQDAKRVLSGFMRHWAQRVYGFWAEISKKKFKKPNADALQMESQAQASLNDSDSGLVAHGFYTSVVVLMDESREKLDESARTVVRQIQALGFKCRLETLNTMEAWLGTLPGHTKENVRSIPMNTLEKADMMPTSAVWAGLPFNPCQFYPPESPPLLYATTSGSTPLRVNLHVDDVGHSLIIGPTGSGKSALLNALGVQARRYENAHSWMFEKGKAGKVTTEATRGQHHDIGAEGSKLNFAPLQELDTETDIQSALQWINVCYELQTKAAPTTDQRDEIYASLQRMAAKKERGKRSITEFCTTCQDMSVRKAMGYYTLSGVAGNLLDAEHDGLSDGRHHCFEVETLMSMPVETSLPVLLHLFRRFERSLDGQPGFLWLDEVWILLAHPVFRAKIEEWLRVLRKANVAVCLATQSLLELAQSGLVPILLESCPTVFFLPNKDAMQAGVDGIPGPRDFYQMWGLNITELNIIRSARRKRHYYLRSPLGRRLFDLHLGPIALSFVTISDKADLRKAAEFKSNYGDAWPFRWLDARGVKYDHLLEREEVAA